MKLGIVVFLFLCVEGTVASHAQQKRQYKPGLQGLNSGLLPDPGITYANMTSNYSADTLRDAGGDKVPLTGSYDIWANMNLFFYVPNSRDARPGWRGHRRLPAKFSVRFPDKNCVGTR